MPAGPRLLGPVSSQFLSATQGTRRLAAHSQLMTTTASSATSSRAQLTRPDGSALRVLVVDDEPSICELLSMALRYEGWEVRTAHDGADAVRAAREFRPDAVVLDVMLPDMDGL